MDVLLDTGVVNWFLGGVYAYTAVMMGLLLKKISSCSPGQYSLVMSKKGLITAFLFAVMMTCVTVSYQNITNDFSEFILWWRLCMISFIAGVSTRLYVFARKVKGMLAWEK